VQHIFRAGLLEKVELYGGSVGGPLPLRDLFFSTHVFYP
jgi:hypothetical protein